MATASLALQSLQEYVILCRPQNVIAFAIRFFKDEGAPNSAVWHAYHCLPYILFEENSFRAFACTIFSYELSLLGPTKDALDTATVLRAINNMSSEEFIVTEAIRQVVAEFIEPLREFAFSAFLVALRVPLCCNACASWANGIFEDYRLLINNPLAISAEPGQLFSYLAKMKPKRIQHRKSVVLARWRAEDEEVWETNLEIVLNQLKSSADKIDGSVLFNKILHNLTLQYISTQKNQMGKQPLR